jgi:uncharacterized repeat protein (TIGR01451 family)
MNSRQGPSEGRDLAGFGASSRRWAVGAIAIAALALALLSALPAASRAATCPPTDLWMVGVGANSNLDRYDTSGNLLSAVPTAEYGDIAWSADGSTLYGVEIEQQLLYVIDPNTGATISTVAMTGLPTGEWLNALSSLPNGNLLIGFPENRDIYEVDPTTGAATQFRASFPTEPGLEGAAGDFLTLPDGDILALANKGYEGVIAYRIKPDDSVIEIGVLPPYEAYGAAQSGGSIYIAGYEGIIYRLDEVPTGESSAPIPVTAITGPQGVEFYGASSIQDSGSCLVEPGTSYTVSKAQSASGTVAPGTVVDYTVTVKNTGTVAYPAGTATFTDDLSGALDDATYVPGSATASAGEVTVGGNALSWQGPLAVGAEPGAAVTVSYSLRVDDPDRGDQILRNTVAATAGGGSCASAGACETRLGVSSTPPAPTNPDTPKGPTSKPSTTAPSTPARACPAPNVTVASFDPTPVPGRTLPGVRLRVSAATPSQISLAARLAYRAGGKERSVSLGTHAFHLDAIGRLRLAVPKALRGRLPVGSRVQVRWSLTGTPDSGHCGSFHRSASVATKVVKVLVEKVS